MSLDPHRIAHIDHRHMERGGLFDQSGGAEINARSKDFHFRLGYIGQYVWQQEGHDL